MKFRIIPVILLAFTFFACEDSLDQMGMGIQPDEDVINVFTDTIAFDAVTVKLDSIYARSVSGSLGAFYDPVYGQLKAGYMCQFYPSGSFRDTVINNKIDSVQLVLMCITSNSIGDPLSPIEATVYPLTKPLEGHYYTNFDPSPYYDENIILGKRAYSIRHLPGVYNSSIQDTIKTLKINLPTEIGDKFLEEFRKPSPNAFDSQEAFIEFFKGIYITPTYGIGSMALYHYTDLNIYYNSEFTTTASDGSDSLYVAKDSAIFNTTKEVIQLHDLKGSHEGQLLEENEEKTYIKSPSGICTKVIIPIPEITKRMQGKKLTNVNLTLSAFARNDWEYSLGLPSNLVLVRPDSIIRFFEEQQSPSITTGTYSATLSSTYTYNFGNISSVIQQAMDSVPDKNLELLVVPVSFPYSNYSNYSVQTYLVPSGLSFKKKEEYMKLNILATDADIDHLSR